MPYFRNADQRGKVKLAWLDSRHTFSFGNYQDPEHMGFGALLVINDDLIEPGGGFGRHGHRDMEIISYVIRGTLAHKDSIGNGSHINAGEIQGMSAGSGIEHSEYNPSQTEQTHFLQIWIEPNKTGIKPSYAQIDSHKDQHVNELTLVASGSDQKAAIRVCQDVEIFLGQIEPGHKLNYKVSGGRKIWIQVVSGELDINGLLAHVGDGIGLEDIAEVSLAATAKTEILLFDLS